MKSQYVRLVSLCNELEKLHARFVHWCERRQMGHAYEVECRTVLQIVDDAKVSARGCRDMGMQVEECVLPLFMLNTLERHYHELKGTLDRIERADRIEKTILEVKW